MKDFLGGILALLVLSMAISIVGCDRDEFKKQHPVEEELLEVAEKAVELGGDTLLHLPSGTTALVVEGLEHELDTHVPTDAIIHAKPD